MDFVQKKPSLDDLVILASEGFRQPITPELIGDVERHLADTDFCVCIFDGGTLVGCMLCKLPIPGVLYIAGTLILPQYQGAGIKSEVTRMVMRDHPELLWFAGRTQSPIVWSSVQGIASELLPHPRPHVATDKMHERRRELARALGMTSTIQQGFYGGALYGEKPINRDGRVQAWWDSICNFERGDAVLYIARL
ncbi:hypothetical protein HZA87_04845 [Candidatus Uhrbacteria bacterium]|nr:hypothetical protein [Candidatus Uhrbacteria bacterium]